jgi:hypothetical protein
MIEITAAQMLRPAPIKRLVERERHRGCANKPYQDQTGDRGGNRDLITPYSIDLNPIAFHSRRARGMPSSGQAGIKIAGSGLPQATNRP